MLKIIVALKKEVGNLSGYDVYYSGCGKVNATISTMEAISNQLDLLIGIWMFDHWDLNSDRHPLKKV